MRAVILLTIVAGLSLSAVDCAEIQSIMKRTGPAFEAGMTPATLGWGEDNIAYPDRFVVNPKDGAEMIWVPAGDFEMGSSPEEIEWAFGQAQEALGSRALREWFDDEGPRHAVRLTRGLWMYRYEVTNSQFRKFKGSHRSGVREGHSLEGPMQPAVRMQWRDAAAYCDWAGPISRARPSGSMHAVAARRRAISGEKTLRWWWSSRTCPTSQAGRPGVTGRSSR